MICALALALMLDVSGSMTDERYKLELDGMANGLATAEIADAITRGPIALTVVEWSSGQDVVMPWRVVTTPAELQRAAADMRKIQRQSSSLTGLGDAMQFAVRHFANVPCQADREVADFAGDGSTNTGSDPSIGRGMAEKQGISFNGLAVVTPGEPNIADYYTKNVRTSDGFVLAANGYEEFAQAMRRKLSSEVSGLQPTTEWAAR